MRALVETAAGPSEVWCVMVDLPGLGVYRAVFGMGSAAEAAGFYSALVRALDARMEGQWERREHHAFGAGSLRDEVSIWRDAGGVERARAALQAVYEIDPARVTELVYQAEQTL